MPADWRLVGYLCLGYQERAAETPELERAGWEKRRDGADILIRR
ncbi:MAG TPA: hypothetical protein VMU85_03500 [Stellaceae bacterium]|nr:hypothetical protein [Stellaceae bacterium]